MTEVAYTSNELWLMFEMAQSDLKGLLKTIIEPQKAALHAMGRRGEKPTWDTHPGVASANRCGMPVEMVKKFSYQMLDGMAYMHAMRMLHRDIKPQNVLVDLTGEILKIADFGLARHMVPGPKNNTAEVVTLWYRAPELMLGDKSYGPPLDVWSLGCTIMEILNGKALFPADCEIDCLFKMYQLLGTPNEKTWPGISKYPYFSKDWPVWDSRPEKSFKAALPLLDSHGIDFLCKLFAWAPSQRISCAEALDHPWLDSVREDCQKLELKLRSGH
eukprot:GHVU01217501.1.p1 GENE.GHVU01217501.1~~GHVU01217501.1.p1  ORF type:complete len:273 (-),score=25.08 GHVU01217501.1:374-1192(-)